MKKLLYLLVLISSVATASEKPDTTWSGPLTISKGGIYENLFIKANKQGDYAIRVYTYDSVTIRNCVVQSADRHIQMFGGTRVRVEHNTFTGIPGIMQLGRVIDNYQPSSFSFINNTVNHTGGIYIDHQEGARSAWIVIENNVILNTDKRLITGAEGEHRAGIMFNTVGNVRGYIRGNYFLNELDKGWIEDGINFNCSGGRSLEDPYIIEGNFMSGAYPSPYDYNTARNTNFTGSFITVEGDSRYNSSYGDVSKFIIIRNNVGVNIMNGIYNVNAGHDIEVLGNTAICSGIAPNGKYSRSFWGGMAKWNAGNLSLSVFHNIHFKGNIVGYYREGVNVGGFNRQDVVAVSNDSNDIKLSDQISLPNPITREMELAEQANWLKKVKGELGNGWMTGVSIPVDTTVITIPGTVTVGKFITGTIQPIDSSGKPANYKTGSIIVTSDSKVSVTYGGVDEKTFKVTGIAPGTSNVTITFVNLYNETISKTVQVTVVAALDRATGATVTWQNL